MRFSLSLPHASARGTAQQNESLGLVVIDEDDHQPLLIHRISQNDIYNRQGGASPFVA